MAFPTQSAVFLDENSQIVIGKRADAPPLKSSTRRQERKVLKDVSNISEWKALKEMSNISTRKPLKDVSNISERKPLKDLSNFSERKSLQNISSTKVTAVKEKPALKEKSIVKEKFALPKTTIFADEDTKKCHEWAKDGLEGAHFTGNESQKFDEDVQDKRVKKKVEKVISAVQGWADMSFVPTMFPAKDSKVF